MTTPAAPDPTAEPTTTPPDTAVVDPTAPPSEDTSGDPSTDRGRAGREAANYRTRLRETEAERDTLRSEVDTYRAREVTRLAKDSGLIEPEDLLNQVSLADLVDGGAVDPERVQSAIAELRTTRPQWFSDYAEHTRPPTNRPIEGLRPGATPRGQINETTTWGSLIRDAAIKRA